MFSKKLILITILFFLLIPFVHAEECGITNLASCIPEKIYEYTITIINAPLQPLLDYSKTLLSEPVDLTLFFPLWAIMVYVISMFYALALLYAGMRFMVSGHDVAMREEAKQWLRNVFLMVVFIQASFFIYSLVVDISAHLSAGVINMIPHEFFLLTADNLVNIGLELVFGLVYLVQLLLAILLLLLRYVIVAFGVVIIPFGIFFYFIPALRDYGKMIFNFLGVIIFITFIDSLIFLICSQLLSVPAFENIKILIMTTAFALANFFMFYFVIWAAIKSAFNNLGGTVRIASKVAKWLV